MTEQDMNEYLNDWVNKTSIPVASDINTAHLREGARSFAAYLVDKVEAKPADTPKEGD